MSGSLQCALCSRTADAADVAWLRIQVSVGVEAPVDHYMCTDCQQAAGGDERILLAGCDLAVLAGLRRMAWARSRRTKGAIAR